MKIKKRILNLASITILLSGCLVLILESACKKDIVNPPGLPKTILDRSQSILFVSFEVETTTSARTVNSSDEALLAPIDEIMAIPHRERYAIEASYKAGNQKEMAITRLTPHDPIVYPSNIADGYLQPDHHRLIISNGTASYYDEANNLIRSVSHSSDANAITKIVDMVANRKSLTDIEFEQGLQIMRDSGMVMQNHANNLVSIRLNNPDGSHCIQVIDKTTRAAVGNMFYDASGVMQSRSMLDVDGNATNPIVRRAFMESRMTSIQGEIPMWVQHYSTFDNFNISYQ
jgi:hypothetical protein